MAVRWTAGLSNTNLAPGTYDVRIRDAAHTACVIILGDKVITYPVILSASVASTQPTCNGTNDGSITISSPAGGSNTFQYSIDGGARGLRV
ncbi:SprB repeat-containing protein [Flavobacterium sp. K5-23]|uniref:SprB repeat-containing protein n=1 Tax=Flavobacterium sp. K5-23 TaxID=2746225 RepID=UPI00200FFC00|nr:SprB repeat-containing protein [Flavobacterium sp. K5-23]UQD57118.1 SprB repeat-containing protein [Flavobacterium sp. K5-23]